MGAEPVAIARALAVLALLAPAAAVASAPDRIGFGMRSSAMAGTGAASADDFEAVYADPAGLAFAGERRLTVGYTFARYGLTLDGAAHPVDGTNGLLIGADLPLPLGGVLEHRLALGLGFYLPIGVVNRAAAPFPGVPWLPLYDSTTQTVTLMVVGAVRLTDWLAIGAGVLALASLDGAIHLSADGTGHVTSQAEEQLVADFAPIAGVRARAARWLRLGAVFRGRSQSRYDIRVDSKLQGVVPFDLPVFAIAGTSQYDPLQVGLEAAFEPGAHLLIAAQATWKRWSDYGNPNPPATAGAPAPESPDFHDTVVPRAALEWRRRLGPLELALRCGYFFEWSPANDASATRTLLDASQHVVTAGAELQLHNRAAPLHLELFGQWHQVQPNGRVGGYFGAGGVSLGLEL